MWGMAAPASKASIAEIRTGSLVRTISCKIGPQTEPDERGGAAGSRVSRHFVAAHLPRYHSVSMLAPATARGVPFGRHSPIREPRRGHDRPAGPARRTAHGAR